MKIDDFLIKYENGFFKNLTLDLVRNNKYFLLDFYDSLYDLPTNYDWRYSSELKLSFIENQDNYSRLNSSFSPRFDFENNPDLKVYSLSSEVFPNDVLKLFLDCPDILILSDDFNNFYVVVRAFKSVKTFSIAYAYMIIDNFVPSFPFLFHYDNSLLSRKNHCVLDSFIERQKGDLLND